MKGKNKAKIGTTESIRRVKRFILKETGLDEDELIVRKEYRAFIEKISAGELASMVTMVAAESKGRNRRRFNAIWSPATGNLRTYFGELVIASKLVTIAGPAPKTSASDRKFNFYSATG